MKTANRPAGKAERKLADFLCFAVYSANLAFGKAYKPLLDELGLTYTQYIAIIALWEDGSQTVSSLAEKLFLESNTVTPILKKLEEAGYVLRKRDARDERQVIVSLTDAGRALREKGFGISLIQSTGLGSEEFRVIQAAVASLRDNLIRATQEKAAPARAARRPISTRSA
ncbi:MAG TPA: MarR family transcriptional regulator [Burkholderiaceae bacterium]|nr:MarR family transcriptional regulator [Burkholderiaceae bacterium]